MHSKIAIVGKMHSGKTTLAQALIDHGYTRFAFADPVKEISAKMLTVFVQEARPHDSMLASGYSYEGINAMKGHPAIRKLLQLVGTELGRQWLGPDTIWIDMFEDRVRSANRYDTKIVNDDCRFPNEAARLKELDFTIIKLERDEDERLLSIQRALEKEKPHLVGDFFHLEMEMEQMMSHPSETNVDLITPTITVPSQSVDQLMLLAKSIAKGEFRA